MFKYPITAQKTFSVPVISVQETSPAPVTLRLWDAADTKRGRQSQSGGRSEELRMGGGGGAARELKNICDERHVITALFYY